MFSLGTDQHSAKLFTMLFIPGMDFCIVNTGSPFMFVHIYVHISNMLLETTVEMRLSHVVLKYGKTFLTLAYGALTSSPCNVGHSFLDRILYNC